MTSLNLNEIFNPITKEKVENINFEMNHQIKS